MQWNTAQPLSDQDRRGIAAQDDAIDASWEAGKALPVALRCTALGGVAGTPSAARLVQARQTEPS